MCNIIENTNTCLQLVPFISGPRKHATYKHHTIGGLFYAKLKRNTFLGQRDEKHLESELFVLFSHENKQSCHEIEPNSSNISSLSIGYLKLSLIPARQATFTQLPLLGILLSMNQS